jgi:hypothetical protein
MRSTPTWASTLSPSGSSASVDTSGGTFTIWDDNGDAFTADLDLNYIQSFFPFPLGGIGAQGIIALTNFEYTGTNFYLNELEKFGSANMVISIQLLPDALHNDGPIDVDYLSSLTRDADAPLYDSSWSGTITGPVVPVPASWLMLATGSSLLGGVGYLRRRFLALA